MQPRLNSGGGVIKTRPYNFKPDIEKLNIEKTTQAKAAHAAMPSNVFIELSLGIDGTPYTAPADGYFAFLSDNRAATATEDKRKYVYAYGLNSIADGMAEASLSGKGELFFNIQVQKGEKIYVYHNLPAPIAGETRRFRFIYANGAK